jgi:chaperone required for assembly of F1-ATPase
VKRFWEKATVADSEGRFVILLDGRPVRLPGGAPVRVERAALADALALEWNAAAAEFSPEDIPLTRLVGTAVERIAPDPAATVAALARYGATDLLCYRAEDRRLAARQAASWDPLLAWAALTLDAPMRVTTGVMPVTQDAQVLGAIARALAAHPPLILAALGVAVPALGSAVLGLALAAGRIEAAEAHALALVEERFQQEFWGLDAEAEARQARIAGELALAERLMALARA